MTRSKMRAFRQEFFGRCARATCDEVVPGVGSTHTALRIAPDRMAALTAAQWVDICVVTTRSLVDSSDGRQ